jgi:ketosteroid isomerase-like protein
VDAKRKQEIETMTTQEVANKLVKLCSEAKFQEAMEALYSPDIVSMEAGAPPGGSREAKGIAAVKAKGEWWVANHEVHSAKVEGPLVAGSHFSVVFKLDVTFKPEGRRFTMEEVAVYKVKDGKIVYEEFFYNM